MKAVVLAAGFATRLYPLTRERPKPLLEVGGRPVLSWILDRVLEVGEVEEVVVVTNGRFHAQFEAWLADYAPKRPVRLVCDGIEVPDERLGAIQDLSLGLVFLDDVSADLLVVAGDNLIDFDLRPHAARFAAGSRPLLLVREIPGAVPPRRYNEVVLDDDGSVASFREKPDDPASNLSALCAYFFPADVRADLGTYLRTQTEKDAPGHFVAWLATRRSLAARRIEGGWHDIGDAETLAAARAAFAARESVR